MFTIFTDTSANLPTPVLKERGIGVIAFSYYADGTELKCTDTESFDGKAYYQSIREGKEVTTSQINPAAYEEAFEPSLKAGNDVLFVSMSSGISGSCQSAKLAALELMTRYPERQIEVVDTLGASLGEGLVALRGADLRDRGVSLQECAEALRQMSESMCQVFTVDNLMHLRRMGRLSNFTAILGSVLNIKPLLKGNEEGKIVSFAKFRGRRKALDALARIYKDFVEVPETQTVGIAHADCPDDAAYLAGLLMLDKPPKEIMTVCYEPVTGAHVGPDTLALFFLSRPGVRTAKLVPDLIDQLPVKDIKELGSSVISKLPIHRNREKAEEKKDN